jgi:hypothetical protein
MPDGGSRFSLRVSALEVAFFYDVCKLLVVRFRLKEVLGPGTVSEPAFEGRHKPQFRVVFRSFLFVLFLQIGVVLLRLQFAFFVRMRPVHQLSGLVQRVLVGRMVNVCALRLYN